jgi:hypothetical protein
MLVFYQFEKDDGLMWRVVILLKKVDFLWFVRLQWKECYHYKVTFMFMFIVRSTNKTVQTLCFLGKEKLFFL